MACAAAEWAAAEEGKDSEAVPPLLFLHGSNRPFDSPDACTSCVCNGRAHGPCPACRHHHDSDALSRRCASDNGGGLFAVLVSHRSLRGGALPEVASSYPAVLELVFLPVDPLFLVGGRACRCKFKKYANMVVSAVTPTGEWFEGTMKITDIKKDCL